MSFTKKIFMRRIFKVGILLPLLIGVFLIHWEDDSPSQTNQRYQDYAAEKIERKRSGDVKKSAAPDLHALIQRELRTREGSAAPEYGPNQVMDEFLKAKENTSQFRTLANEFSFVERGPGNVAGRTRAILVDPDDVSGQTWYAGSASGGIWKTTNSGQDWTFISGDIPNLGTNTLAMSPANSSVIYAGTGEHFTNDIDGAGIFKSADKGATWIQIGNPSDYPDMKNVSRIVVNPDNENIVIATTRNSVWDTNGLQAAIYKTVDGGGSWSQLRSSTSERYDDIAVDPNDFNTIYVAIDSKGVIKSTDGGSTWVDSSTGMTPAGRVEIAISPINSTRLWASVQGGLSGNGSDLYVTSDGGSSWSLALNSGSENEDFLGGQGWFDNYATAHPFDEDIVYVGGVNNWKFELNSAVGSSLSTILVSENGSQAFMDFINFGGDYLGGGMEVLEGLTIDDLVSIEIRFGQGTQKAHRFTVGGLGAGVPPDGYFYEDYVDVPFQVWDTNNNIQLMISFRDQQEDGSWNLIEANTSGAEADHSREYFFIHNIPYNTTTPDPDIIAAATTAGTGIESGQMYFFWPVLASGATFDPNGLPASTLNIDITEIQTLERITTNISDAYNQFGGPNAFPQSSRDQGIHPDQHNNIITGIDESSQTFNMILTNDGGVYETVTSNDPGPNEGDFIYASHGYNTTQFYGADKAPDQNRFIGGMQDNGTWYHSIGVEGGVDANATFGIGGDGFESLWHSTDENKLLGGSQFNNFAKTEDGGNTWFNATVGFDDNGPFITRLNHHKSIPDRVFTVGALGVWKSETFGGNWTASTMNDPSFWAFSNSSDVEISYANPNVIWAGARLSSTGRLYVSTDGGDTFDPIENYTEFNMGATSGIGTHPVDDKVAYALFSFSGFPKVLKTEDLGQTWEDISGFDGSGDRGFPDVAVNCIFVFPTNQDRIWVGSEIGIIESLDGGNSWNLLDSNFPAVNTYDFKLVGNTIVIATYGRGIWSVEIPDFPKFPSVSETTTSPSGQHKIIVDFTESFDSTYIYVDNEYIKTLYDNAPGSITESISSLGINGFANIRFELFRNGRKFSSTAEKIFLLNPSAPVPSYGTTFEEAEEDFVGQGFKILFGARGFSKYWLHSNHQYSPGENSFVYLRSPITVSASAATLTYKDVAIVEPINDKVIVEGSIDGENWTELSSYDASNSSSWKSAFDSGISGDEKMAEEQNIDLLEYFNAGDVILIRFRMESNESIQAYGWAIKDLYIQEERVLSVNSTKRYVSVSPNPIKDYARIVFKEQVPELLTVIDLNGKVVDNISFDGYSNSIEYKPNLNPGLYFIHFQMNGTRQVEKIIIKD